MPSASVTGRDGQTTQAAEVENFRRAAIANGYRVVRVKSKGKRPVTANWTQGEQLSQLLPVTSAAANTGICTSGLRVIDIDVDDESKIKKFLSLVTPILPPGGLFRRRRGSCRMAWVFRAAESEPCKVAVGGRHGKIEVLGRGQQLVAHGIHESGSELFWFKGRSPATVAQADLPSIDEACVRQLLDLAKNVVEPPDDVLSQRQPIAEMPVTSEVISVVSDLAAGIPIHRPFEELAPERKHVVVSECLDALDNRASDPRKDWLSVLFAVADAGRCGCPDARSLALEWSRRGCNWTSEADFDAAWNSYKPGRMAATTVGTLFHLARRAGVEIAGLFESSSAGREPAGEAPLGALPVSALPSVPPKRQWLHGFDLIRGAVSLIVAPGAKGKSSWLGSLALACASGRPILSSHVFGGPLRVLYINAEDATTEVALRLRAAMVHHQLADRDLPALFVAGADRLSLTLIKVEKGTPALNEGGWQNLRDQISQHAPDVLILDPLVALVGGATLNDNAAAALLMREFVRLAASCNLSVMLAHHTAKGRELNSADAAMGAASIVNLARISLAIEPLKADDAPKIGVAPWDAAKIFRVTGTKQNLAPASTDERWFRLVSVEMPNAEPPIYTKGDSVGVVEAFTPSLMATPYPQAMIDAALIAIGAAVTPLSPSPKSATYAIPIVANAIAPFRNGVASELEAKAMIQYLLRTGRLQSGPVQVSRTGRGGYTRQGFSVVGPLPTPAPSGATPTPGAQAAPASAGATP